MLLAIPAFATGIAFLQFLPDLPTRQILALLWLFLVLLIFLRLKKQNVSIPFYTLLISLLTGFCWAAALAHYRLNDNLPEEWQARDIRITGIVAQLPQRFEHGERFVFDVESVQTPDTHVPSKILLSWYHNTSVNAANPMTTPGERWTFTVRLKRPRSNINLAGFDYEAWLLERGIRATGYVRADKANQRIDSFVPAPWYFVQYLRDRIRNRFIATLPDHNYTGILTALAVGDQQAIPNEQWQLFNRTGITHLMSISGLHITMIAALFSSLVNILWRRSEKLMLIYPAQKAAILSGWLAAFCYTLLSGFAIPAQRTLYMLTVVAIALCSGKNLGVSRILLLSLLAVLFLDPWAVLATGFWLSFGTVAILLFVGNFRTAKGRNWKNILINWTIAQSAVTMLCIPLLLFFFQKFSLVSPLANALAIPVISFIITPLALLFAVFPCPWLIELNHWLLAQLMSVISLLADWPIWEQPAPPILAVFIALIGITWLWMPKGFPARFMGIFLMLPALLWNPARPEPREAWVDILDVGQGLSVVIRTHRHNLLYDVGPKYSNDSDAAQRIVIPFLRSANINRLDTLIISHQDKDHSGGLAAILDNLSVDQLISSLPEISERTPAELCHAGKNWQWDGIEFTFLHPDLSDYPGSPKRSNDLSCVLRISNGTNSVLLTADIEAPAEKILLKRNLTQLKSDILLVPHHGGAGSSTPPFITAVNASDVIFSVGYLNPFKHPRKNIVERYQNSRQWRTDHDGAIHITLSEVREVTGLRHTRKRYWYD